MELCHFYVLYDNESKAFVQDSQFAFTDIILNADQYSTFEEAQKELSYYNDEYRKRLSVKKITLMMSNT